MVSAATGVVVALLVAPFVVLALLVWADPAHLRETDPPTPARITEDMPGWDCQTMGNRICGDGTVSP